MAERPSFPIEPSGVRLAIAFFLSFAIWLVPNPGFYGLPMVLFVLGEWSRAARDYSVFIRTAGVGQIFAGIVIYKILRSRIFEAHPLAIMGGATVAFATLVSLASQRTNDYLYSLDRRRAPEFGEAKVSCEAPNWFLDPGFGSFDFVESQSVLVHKPKNRPRTYGVLRPDCSVYPRFSEPAESWLSFANPHGFITTYIGDRDYRWQVQAFNDSTWFVPVGGKPILGMPILDSSGQAAVWVDRQGDQFWLLTSGGEGLRNKVARLDWLSLETSHVDVLRADFQEGMIVLRVGYRRLAVIDSEGRLIFRHDADPYFEGRFFVFGNDWVSVPIGRSGRRKVQWSSQGNSAEWKDPLDWYVIDGSAQDRGRYLAISTGPANYDRAGGFNVVRRSDGKNVLRRYFDEHRPAAQFMGDHLLAVPTEIGVQVLDINAALN